MREAVTGRIRFYGILALAMCAVGAVCYALYDSKTSVARRCLHYEFKPDQIVWKTDAMGHGSATENPPACFLRLFPDEQTLGTLVFLHELKDASGVTALCAVFLTEEGPDLMVVASSYDVSHPEKIQSSGAGFCVIGKDPNMSVFGGTVDPADPRRFSIVVVGAKGKVRVEGIMDNGGKIYFKVP